MMMSADENQPIAGPSQIDGKTETPGNKPEKRRRKPNQKPDQKSASGSDTLPEAIEPLPEAQVQMDIPIAPAESHPVSAFASQVSSVESAASAPVSVQAITDAYGDYTRKSVEQTSSFFEHLMGTRSLSKALEIQNEFALTAFETFVHESRKIRDLHRELAKQRLRNLEGFVMGRAPR